MSGDGRGRNPFCTADDVHLNVVFFVLSFHFLPSFISLCSPIQNLVKNPSEHLIDFSLTQAVIGFLITVLHHVLIFKSAVSTQRKEASSEPRCHSLRRIQPQERLNIDALFDVFAFAA